ncbi:MAG TPA: peroxiredoxin-like family protein [Pseudonocardiaceae bacterium]|nr:peroxiredoxin-like family protein [Pseudonocardiaceae bacterium]
MTSSTVSIADQVGAFNTAVADQIPAEALTTFTAEQARLDAAGVPAGVAAPGAVLPDVELLDVHGAPTSLFAVTGGRPAVIVFYRGAWCPYCNIALKTYQDQLLPQLNEHGIALVAISPQKPDGSLSSQQKNALAFPVMSDPGNVLADRLGILSTPSAQAQAAMAQLGLDLTAANADGTPTLPMPTVVIADADHTIRWIDVHPDYTNRTEVADIINALDAVQ